MHSEQLQMHSKKLYYTAGSFIAQQKVLLHDRKVSLAAETGKRFLLRQKQRISPLCSVFPWTWTRTQRLRTTWQWQNGTLKPILQSARPDFLPGKRNVKKTPHKPVIQTHPIIIRTYCCFEKI